MSTTRTTEISPSNTAVTKASRWPAVIVVGLCLVGFIAIAISVMAGHTQAWEERILLSLRDPVDPTIPIGAQYIGEAVRDLTSLGGFAVLIAITVLSVVYFRLNDNVRASRFTGLTIVSGFVVSVILKSIFERPRPDVVPHLADFTMSSFPSAHAMMSAIIYPTLAWLLAQHVERHRVSAFLWTVALALAILIGASRVYVGVHYASDVLAGWLAGFGWFTLCVLAARWFGIPAASNDSSR